MSRVGIYTEYLDKNLGFADLTAERKKQLQRIADIRKSDVLVIAADLNKSNAQISLGYIDLLPVSDQLSNLNGSKLDVILETPGGSGEVAEDIVKAIRTKFMEFAVIVPGWAKSAGTIIAMAADEILMSPQSALGPIDAQLFWQGKIFSADALLEGFEKIKREVTSTGALNKAYIPILQGLSPGELQSAENALAFARQLVGEWLVKYKFKNWAVHSSTSKSVTDEERKARAAEIAGALCNHGRWLTHSRSIKINDLRAMKVVITDYTENAELSDAITRYHTLLQITFASNIYKIYETPKTQISKMLMPAVPGPQMLGIPAKPGGKAGPTGGIVPESVELDLQCNNCQATAKVQGNLRPGTPLKPGYLPFPANNRVKCPQCGTEQDLSDARRQIEAQTKRKLV